jgi:hypothetical protein
MNIEELKLVLDTIRQLSGDASTAAYWYFGLEFAKFVIGGGVGAWLAFTIIKIVAKAAGIDQDEKFMRECRDALDTGMRGYLDDDERVATQQAIRKLIQERKQ